MTLYDAIIWDTYLKLKDFPHVKLNVDREKAWKQAQRNELVLQKSTEYELGGSGLPGVAFSCVTTSKRLVKDEILLYGKDLPEIKEDVPFGKIIFLELDGLDETDKSYHTIKNLEFVKYDLFLEGYMMRASTIDKREQVRISRNAVKKGINFAAVANSFINKYKENPLVKKAAVIFISGELPVFQHFRESAKKVDNITMTMNHVLNSLDMDCFSCGLKKICDEVEGLKTVHIQQARFRTFAHGSTMNKNNTE